MNTRQELQPPSTDVVNSISYSQLRARFVTGLDTGLRAFRTDNCFTTYKPDLGFDGGLLIAEALDDRWYAFVCAHKGPGGGPNFVVFWDAFVGRELNRFNLHEPVKAVKLTTKWMAVVLKERTVVFFYQQLQPPDPPTSASADSPAEDDAKVEPEPPLFAPNQVHTLLRTALNPYGLACMTNELIVLPAQAVGQVQLVQLKIDGPTTKRVLRAHNSSLRCMALSPDGTHLATASEQGTLIRVYDTKTLSQIAEFRRGSDHAIISSLAFSPSNRWVASTSDKGTLHVFDLRPKTPTETPMKYRQQGKPPSYASHRLSGAGYDKDSVSGTSAGYSSPAPSSAIGTSAGGGYQGSVQEYYGLRPPPTSASPPARDAAVSAMAALKASPFAPRIFKDARSVASAPFYIGNDPSHWQGGSPSSVVTAPDGSRRRVQNQVLPLPNNPSGKPPKGIIAFAPANASSNEDEGAIIYVIGGGTDSRWEMFQLVSATAEGANGGWSLVNKGFRKYLTRQFAD
ncbi:SVP1 2 [Lecanosticta acicola]|uniref:SVP1 2 n=1 Tax=Lecanosticta acicola TaxID=111012 RepID=A0AAI8Z250_9PEZI|nr:SVP1 2 [Lecanosticta acicola]